VHRQSHTCRIKQTKKGDDFLWQKTQCANLIRYKPSKAYFARIRIGGKLIRLIRRPSKPSSFRCTQFSLRGCFCNLCSFNLRPSCLLSSSHSGPAGRTDLPPLPGCFNCASLTKTT